MAEQTLHPSVQKFKQFVKNHPLLVNEVREGRKTWQDFYEEWVILGENHVNWESYRKPVKVEKASEEKEAESTKSSSGDSSEALSHLIGLIKNMNFEDIQRHIAQLSNILASVQQLMGIFQGGQNQNQKQPYEQPHDPFSFRGF